MDTAYAFNSANSLMIHMPARVYADILLSRNTPQRYRDWLARKNLDDNDSIRLTDPLYGRDVEWALKPGEDFSLRPDLTGCFQFASRDNSLELAEPSLDEIQAAAADAVHSQSPILMQHQMDLLHHGSRPFKDLMRMGNQEEARWRKKYGTNSITIPVASIRDILAIKSTYDEAGGEKPESDLFASFRGRVYDWNGFQMGGNEREYETLSRYQALIEPTADLLTPVIFAPRLVSGQISSHQLTIDPPGAIVVNSVNEHRGFETELVFPEGFKESNDFTNLWQKLRQARGRALIWGCPYKVVEGNKRVRLLVHDVEKQIHIPMGHCSRGSEPNAARFDDEPRGRRSTGRPGRRDSSRDSTSTSSRAQPAGRESVPSSLALD